MRIVPAIAALLIAACSPATSQPVPVPPSAPRLIVVLSVDQLSADLFDEYRPHFTGGLARLAKGTVFRNGYQSHAATETCPGHATILTGVRPGRSGIVANNWLDQSAGRDDKTLYCAEDERAPGSSSANYTVSPRHLGALTLGERLRLRWPDSRTVAVAGKDRSAVMLGGQAPSQRWYWNGKGAFVTDLGGHAPTRSVSSVNAQLKGRLEVDQPGLDPAPLCQARAKRFAVGRTIVGDGTLARRKGDAKGLRATPEFDAATLALAAGLAIEMQLGRRNAPDVLAIGLSATDHVGHAYGSGGQEMCLQLTELDRELESFFVVLDRSGVDYAVVMTADHGGLDLPERLSDKGVAAERVDPALGSMRMSQAIAARLGLAGPVLFGERMSEDSFFGDLWVNRALSRRDRSRVITAAVAAYRRMPQVEAIFTAAELRATPAPAGPPDRWTLRQRVRASFDPRRSGDLYLVLKERVMPIPGDGKGALATHGSVWDYDRRVPIIFWRKGMAAAERPEAIETVDILPTLAGMVGLPVDRASIDGRCRAIAGVTCP